MCIELIFFACNETDEAELLVLCHTLNPDISIEIRNTEYIVFIADTDVKGVNNYLSSNRNDLKK